MEDISTSFVLVGMKHYSMPPEEIVGLKRVILAAEPDNAYDKNAIRVLAFHGRQTLTPADMLGYCTMDSQPDPRIFGDGVYDVLFSEMSPTALSINMRVKKVISARFAFEKVNS